MYGEGTTTGQNKNKQREGNNGKMRNVTFIYFLFERIKIFIPLCFLSEKYSHILVYFTTFSKFVSIAKVCNNALKQSSEKKHQINMPACPAVQEPISQSLLSSKIAAVIMT